MGVYRVGDEDVALSEELLSFIRRCPSPFHTVHEIRRRLDAAGFLFMPEAEAWQVEPGGRYYTVRNGSSVVAFAVGERMAHPSFRVAASHADSPTYKLKAHSELAGPGDYVRLNVEGYGGMIDRTWLDRPLSVAGRVMVEEDGRVASRLLYVDRDVLLIPSVAVHLNRAVNDEGALNRRIDLCPLASAGVMDVGSFEELVARELGVEPSKVLARDLVLVNRQAPVVWGGEREFVSAPRLDDLQCAFASLTAFLQARNERSVLVYACFDNEEVGSGTMQGALSTLLPDVLKRISASVGGDGEGYRRAVAQSFLVSCDNAHAVHPNHAELYDESNRVWLNRGVVIKEAANQRYVTDAFGRALFESVCRHAGVPTQAFANRSDMLGGSTLGNLATRRVSMHAVDVGLPQLAMHSAYETAGVKDTGYLVEALRAFYSMRLSLESDGSIALD